tara:strand:- start:195 stop:431 length:237 start_codon:yes stop_codon:yes gene_type:complete
MLTKENVCVAFCALVLVVVLVMFFKFRSCGCGMEGFKDKESFSGGISDELMNRFKETETQLNDRLNDLEARVTKLEGR